MPQRSCLAASVDLLARREHGCRELKDKLVRKGYEVGEVDKTIQRLLTDDLVSDERYAASFTRGRVAKGYGPVRILQELRQKGITDTIAQSAIDDADNDWMSVAVRVYEKKFTGAPADFRERSKRIQFLRYKGFSMDLIARVIDQD